MNPTTRFSNRVENYVKYRPAYPKEVVSFLEGRKIINPQSVIADIGSGTGISAKLFLDNACTVYGIEPNEPMRKAGESYLASYPKFHSINATAEETTLPNQSVDCIIAAQAFHWFNTEKCKAEFKRILKPGGYIVLIWNDRLIDTTPFLKAYEQLLLTYAIDYTQVNHRNIDSKQIAHFFSFFTSSKENSGEIHLNNAQQLNYNGIKGRLLSSSYVPSEGNVNYSPMLAELEQIYKQYNQNGEVSFDYDTAIYYVRLS